MFESHMSWNAQFSGVLDPRALGANYSLSDYGGLRHSRRALIKWVVLGERVQARAEYSLGNWQTMGTLNLIFKS